MSRRARASFAAELRAVAFLAPLSDDQVADLAGRALRTREPAGMVFSKEGERGDEMVVVLDGEVEVRRDGRVVATLGPGAYVGEMALLAEQPIRTATVVARTPVVIAYLARHDVETVLAAAPAVLAELRATVAARAAAPPPAAG